jgi:TonB-linked SusC/RagA family outer membrane protein
MQSSVDVDEVVVTALGISREKKSLGYSSQGVSEDELMATNDLSPISSLSGKVAGLTIAGQNFAGSQNILIRGANSFSSNNQPLFVVDGTPISNEGFNDSDTQRGAGGYDYGSMTADLNSYDIADVQILKGSAASALYGSRGANGVIMITTKSGKKGKKSFSVDVNTGINFETVSIIPELQHKYGGGYGDFSTGTVDGTSYDLVYYAMDESWGPKYEGQEVLHWWGIEDYQQGVTSSPETGAWEDPKGNDVRSFYETGVSYQNSITLTTSNESSALKVGYTNVSMTGTVPNSSQDKNSFNIKGNADVFDDIIEVDASLNFVHTYTKGRPQFGYGDNSQSQKFFQWGQRQLNFSKLKNYKNADGSQRVWNRKSLTDSDPNYSDNPYWTAYENYQDDERYRLFGKAGVKANVTSYLSLSGAANLDTYTFDAMERTAIGSQATSGYSLTQRQATEVNYEGKIAFHKKYNDFDVIAFIGGNTRKQTYSRFAGETSGGLVIAGLYNLSNSSDTAETEEYNEESQVNSWFGAASFGYKNFAYLDATYRKDYDSTLPDDNNSYDYFSVSGSFIASELLDVSWINNLKLRLNYGETGNGTDPYNVYNTYVTGDSFDGTLQFYNSTTLNNNNLKPELTSEYELGLEGVLLNHRLGFDFSYYNRTTKNQIVSEEVSGASGYTYRYINAGEINNRGVELVLYGTPVQQGGFSWDVSINYAQNTNEVKDIGEDIQLSSATFSGAYLKAIEGATFQELVAYNYAYDGNGNKVIDADTGFYEQGDLESVGSVLPDWTGGIKNTFNYKGVSLSILIDASVGGKYYSLTNMWGMYSGMAKNTATATSDGNTIREDGLVLDGVVDDGNGNYSTNTTNISAEDYGAYHYHGYGTPSTTSIFDATYYKLRELSVGYTLPQLFDVVKSIRVSAYGRNLATWGLDNKGMDPETIVGGNGNIQGLEGGIVPGTKTYGFNLQFKF